MGDSDTIEMPRVGRLDRRRDLAGWLLTPLITIVAAPIAAAIATVAALTQGNTSGVPQICQARVAENRCEEITLGMLGQHAVIFAGIWLLLWVVPWWRGLRWLRTALAIVAALVLIAAPMRMGASA